MSQSLEILNCDEELIFMDNLRSADIDNMVSGAYFFSNLVGEACPLKKFNGLIWMGIVSFILVTLMFDSTVILKGIISCQSLSSC